MHEVLDLNLKRRHCSGALDAGGDLAEEELNKEDEVDEDEDEGEGEAVSRHILSRCTGRVDGDRAARERHGSASPRPSRTIVNSLC